MRGFRHRLSYGPPLRQIVCPTWRYNSDAGKQNGRHGGHEFGVEENSRMVGAPPSVRSPGVNGSTFPERCPASWGLPICTKCGRQSFPTATAPRPPGCQNTGPANICPAEEHTRAQRCSDACAGDAGPVGRTWLPTGLVAGSKRAQPVTRAEPQTSCRNSSRHG